MLNNTVQQQCSATTFAAEMGLTAQWRVFVNLQATATIQGHNAKVAWWPMLMPCEIALPNKYVYQIWALCLLQPDSYSSSKVYRYAYRQRDRPKTFKPATDNSFREGGGGAWQADLSRQTNSRSHCMLHFLLENINSLDPDSRYHPHSCLLVHTSNFHTEVSGSRMTGDDQTNFV